ncbi:MAG TPA: hypothetical protein VK166_04980 [Chitinophagaceae bacterium]|nr:hypothetical protein [Chitinophagaceae bacterium]
MISICANAQEPAIQPIDEISIIEYFKSDARKARDSIKAAQKKPKKVYLVGIPSISSSPVTGFSVGVALSAAFVMGGDPKTTRFSSVNVVGAVTAKKQQAISLSNHLYFKDEEWILHGSLNWRIFPMFTWGIGGGTPDNWGGQLENDGLTLDQMLMKKIGNKWYFGGGLNMDWIYKQNDENQGKTVDYITDNRSNTSAEEFWNGINDELPFVIKSDEIPPQFNDDWVSNKSAEYIQQTYFQTPFQIYPYGTAGSIFYLGLTAAITHDTRDNINSTRSGSYFNFNYSFFPKGLSSGGGENWALARLDMRKFWRLRSDKNILAAKLYVGLVTGKVPYTAVPANATDEGTATRGYTSFRYRGDNYLSGEVEYRRHIWKFLAGQVFLNAHTISEEKDYLAAMHLPLSDDGKFRYLNPGYGLGLNIILNQKSRSTFRIDYAWNKFSFTSKHDEGKQGVFYMGLNTAF